MKTQMFVLIGYLLFINFGCNKDSTPKEMCSNKNEKPTLTKTSMNGVSFENVNYDMEETHVLPIKEINATWVTTMPFGFILADGDSVQYNNEFQWVGEKKTGVAAIIKTCHEQGLKVMLKPHIWISDGSWVGDLSFDTEEEWQTFEKSYLTYIVDFATLADSMNAEAFSIGVELKNLVTERPAFWPVLIDTVRDVYSGTLTYAANWDNYQNVGFWNELDLIGIDAYFPVGYSKTPTFNECYQGWSENFEKLKTMSQSVGKNIVFTEFGYRNIDYCGKEPWDENGNATFNTEAQKNAYEAIFYRFWGESWFEGGFLWKWHPNDATAGGEENNRFTPQNKPVEALISKIYKETN